MSSTVCTASTRPIICWSERIWAIAVVAVMYATLAPPTMAATA